MERQVESSGDNPSVVHSYTRSSIGPVERIRSVNIPMNRWQHIVTTHYSMLSADRIDPIRGCRLFSSGQDQIVDEGDPLIPWG